MTDDAGPGPAAYELLDLRSRVQTCAVCSVAWPGRPLIGLVQVQRQPLETARLLLSDGYRSASRPVSPARMAGWRAPEVAVALLWEALEEQLLDGVTDRRRQEVQAAHRARTVRRWDWVGRLTSGPR